MRLDKKDMLLYAVTDRSWTGRQTLYEQVESALKGGITCLQLREKELDDDAFTAEAIQISALCRRYGVPFIINDNVEVALRCGADGVHVGQDDMDAAAVRARAGKDLIIGVSAHSVEEALRAVEKGADYLGVGSMFSTSTKSNVVRLNNDILLSICSAVDVPVVAIGGIGKSNILTLKGTGVDGAALVSAIFSAEDIENECRLLRSLSEQMVNE
ncbi:MAG: thiamine phosphate synthase [Firmicutes bacterium]|nr:thiamine phosphate synthase [Bacillota bacterium]